MENLDTTANLIEKITEGRKELKDNIEKRDQVKKHIKALQEYNAIKDATQILLGKLATLEKATTKDLYERFGLELDD